MVKGRKYRIYTGIEEGVYWGPDEIGNPIFLMEFYNKSGVSQTIPWPAIKRLEPVE